MSHKHNGSLPVVILFGRICNRCNHSIKVPVTCQQGLSQSNTLKIAFVLCQLICQICVLKPIHQMGRLHYQSLYAVCRSSFQGFLHIINLQSVPFSKLVNDNLGSISRSQTAPWNPFLNIRFYCFNRNTAVFIVAGAETHHQNNRFFHLILYSFLGFPFFYSFRLLHRFRGLRPVRLLSAPAQTQHRGHGHCQQN